VRSASPSGVVPYMTLREGELPAPESMLSIRCRKGRPVRLAYVSETTRDRDDSGVLWARVSQSLHPTTRLPVGRPDFAAVHPSRQREAMSSLRCQVCMRPADKNADGYLFLEVADGRLPGEGVITSQPPVCLRHAAVGIERCSHLLDRGYRLMRVRTPRLYGVVGTMYRPTRAGLLEPVPLTGPDGRDTAIPYTNRAITAWVLAAQLVRRLTGVTRVDLDAELAAAEAGSPAASARPARTGNSER
jgi:hypothetical protein